MSILGDRLKELREEREILSKDFAKIMNVEPSTVTNWEKGNRFPKEDVLIKLADYFDVSVDYLLGRTNEKNNIKNIKIDKQISEITLGERVDSYLRENGINPDEMTEEQRKDIAEQFVKLFIAFKEK